MRSKLLKVGSHLKHFARLPYEILVHDCSQKVILISQGMNVRKIWDVIYMGALVIILSFYYKFTAQCVSERINNVHYLMKLREKLFVPP